MTPVPNFSLTMKHLAFASALALAAASTASADQLRITANNWSNESNGGSYTVANISGSLTNSSYSSLAIMSAGTFETFCLEPTETFNSGSIYNYTVGSAAVGGGNEVSTRNVGTGDQISVGTAYLYSLFATGNLSVFNYGSGREASNLILQRVIWSLEDDYSSSYIGSSVYNSILTTQFGSITNARANATYGQYGVFAINLTSNDGTQRQSQTYYHVNSMPDSGNAAILLGSAFVALTALRRIRRQRRA